MADHVTVVEVGPRDGLQNESATVPTAEKIALVDGLTAAGLPVIEVTSFVSPARVPQLADAEEVFAGITRRDGVRYPVLVPNLRGLERARVASVAEIAVFAAASEAFSEANIGVGIDASLEIYANVVATATSAGLRVRGYVSTALGCPYQGDVPPHEVARVALALRGMGCDEISIGDTIGVGTPETVERLLESLLEQLPAEHLALHLHDTRGRALENVEVGLSYGLRTFDSAVSGLGGCPFAPGAPGNLATEALVEFLEARGLRTGVDLDAVRSAGLAIRRRL
jgi:hydroxymethylglutaryl-CoA lyase